jgi:hypothetical protein
LIRGTILIHKQICLCTFISLTLINEPTTLFVDLAHR